MTQEELAMALRRRGLTVTVVGTSTTGGCGPGAGLAHGPGRGLRVSRYRSLPFLDETVTVVDGQPFWSWGKPIAGDGVDEIAERIDQIVSRRAECMSNSS